MFKKILESIFIGMTVFAIMMAFGFEKSIALTYDDVPKVVKEVVKEKIVYKPNSSFSEEEVYLLAQCVEAEAGINNTDSQKYVAQVILNRVNSDSFPDSIEEVIFEKNGDIPQFSVAYNGMMNREVRPETLTNVYKVLTHGTDLPDYVLFFYSNEVEDNWVTSLNTYDVVEGTVFAYCN